jgi:hypothetical protein
LLLQVTLGQPFNCTSPLVLHWLLPAAWSLQVVGQDLANNSADPLKVDWSVEYQAAAAPYTRFLRCGGVLAPWFKDRK